VKKIYTMSQVARALEVTKERARVWWNKGGKDSRMLHDIEDQDGRPYWSRVPNRPEAIPPGRKTAKGGRR
jgi:hypothetical protein